MQRKEELEERKEKCEKRKGKRDKEKKGICKLMEKEIDRKIKKKENGEREKINKKEVLKEMKD